jgi:uncharacterized membrane protein YkvA (DUF1232 family)
MATKLDLDEDIRAIIRTSFKHACEDLGEYEYTYIENKMESKKRVYPKSSLSWLKDLFNQYEVLYRTLSDNYPASDNLSAEGVRKIAAALFYFINPYDIIPDTIGPAGYLDDWYVFELCLESLSENDKDYVTSELNTP